MKMVLTSVVVFIALFVQAQQKLTFGRIKNDSNFNCATNRLLDDSLRYGIEDICSSKNQLEIRLSRFDAHSSDLIILSFKDSIWTIKNI
jgi:hypothetical protein